MPHGTSLYDFAMVLDVQPHESEARWEAAVRAATPPAGWRVTVRRPTVLIFVAEDVHEITAIGRAEDWLKDIAARMMPPVEIKTNAQPSNEV